MNEIEKLKLMQLQILDNQMILAKILKLITMQFPNLETKTDCHLQNMVDKTNLMLDRVNEVGK